MTDSIRAEVRALVESVMNPDAQPKAPPQQRTRSARGESRSRPPAYDRARILKLHEQGMRVGEIARTLGAHRTTISRALNEAGVDPEVRTGGPIRRELCGKGLHSMAEYGRELKRGGRFCIACQRIRQRRALVRARPSQPEPMTRTTTTTCTEGDDQ